MASGPAIIQLLAKINANATEFVGEVNKARLKLKEFVGDVAQATADMSKKIATEAAAFGAAVGGGLALAGNKAMDFEAAMAKVSSLLTKEERLTFLEQLSEGALAISRDFGIAGEEVAEAMADAVGSGVEVSKVYDFVRSSAQAAKAGMTDLASVVDITTSVMAAYRDKGYEAGYVQDVLFRAVDKGKIEFKDFSQYLGAMLPIAAAANVGIEEVAGAIATLTVQGFKPATAMDGLKSMLSGLIRPTEDAKETAAALGIQFDATAIQTKGLQGFLQDMANQFEANGNVIRVFDEKGITKARKGLAKLQERIAKLNQELAQTTDKNKRAGLQKKLIDLQSEANKATKELDQLYKTAAEELDQTTGMAKMFTDIQGLAAALALTNNGGKAFNETMGHMQNSSGATAHAFEAFSNTAKFAWEQMKQVFNSLLIYIGQGLGSVLGPALTWLSQQFQRLSKWMTENPEKAKALGKAIALIGVILTAAAGVVAVFATGLAVAAGVIASVATVAGAPLLAFFAVILPLFGLLAGAIAFVIANWDQLMAWAVANWPSIKNTVMSAITPIWNALKQVGSTILTTLVGAGKQAVGWLTANWPKVSQVIQKGADWVAKVAIPAIGQAIQWLIEKFIDLAHWVNDNWPLIQWTLEKGWEALVAAFKWAKVAINGVLETLDLLWNKMGLGKAVIAAAGAALKTYAVVVESVAKAFDWVQKAVVAAVDAVREWFNLTGGKNVPGLPAGKGGAATGAISVPPVQKFAEGGIVTRPTWALSGEAGPEAFVPLENGSIPVELKGEARGGDMRLRERTDSRGDTYHITVVQQPGESTDALLQRLGTKIQRKRR